MHALTANLLGPVKTTSHVCTGTRLGNKISKDRTSHNTTLQFPLLQIQPEQTQSVPHRNKAKRRFGP